MPELDKYWRQDVLASVWRPMTTPASKKRHKNDDRKRARFTAGANVGSGVAFGRARYHRCAGVPPSGGGCRNSNDAKRRHFDAEIKGEIRMIRMLQGLLCTPLSDQEELCAMGPEQLEALTASLQEKLHSRTAS